MSDSDFYQFLAWAWLAITILNFINLLLSKRLTSFRAWDKVLLPLLLFSAYLKIVQILTQGA
jgi:hypothetical protein